MTVDEQIGPIEPGAEPTPADLSATDLTQPQDDLVRQVTHEMFQIRNRFIQELQRCGGEQAILMLFRLMLPPNLQYALLMALEHEGDVIVLLINAVRTYLQMMYMPGGGGNEPSKPKRKRKAEDVAEDQEPSSDGIGAVDQEIQQEVIRQAVRHAFESVSKPQQETGAGASGIFGQLLSQMIAAQLQKQLSNISMMSQPSQPSQQPQQKQKVDISKVITSDEL